MEEIVKNEPFLLAYYENEVLIYRIFINNRKANFIRKTKYHEVYLEQYMDKKIVLIDLNNVVSIKTFKREYLLDDFWNEVGK